MDLTETQRDGLEVALDQAFRSDEEFRKLFRLMGEQRALPGEGTPARRIVDWAAREGRLRDLIDTAYTRVPGNPALSRFVRSLPDRTTYLNLANIDVFVTVPPESETWAQIHIPNLESDLVRELQRPVKVASTLGDQIPKTLRAKEVGILVVAWTSSSLANPAISNAVDSFISTQGREDPYANVVVAELARPSDDDDSLVLRKSRRVPFWSREIETVALRTDLYRLVADRLRVLAKTPDSRPQGELVDKVVILGQVPEELEAQRANLWRYFEQLGATVLPRGRYSDSLDSLTDLRQDLSNAHMLIQVARPGDLAPGAPGPVAKQMRLALEAGTKIAVFKAASEMPQGTKSADPLPGSEFAEYVRDEPMQQFKDGIVEELKVDAVPAKAKQGLWFCNAQRADQSVLNERVEPSLMGRQFVCLRPLMSSTSDETLKWFEQSILACEYLLHIYGSSPAWVLAQHLIAKRFAASRTTPLKLEVIYDAPPEDKEDLPMRALVNSILPCRQSNTAFEELLDQLGVDGD
jgi:hypothetical protein